MSQWQALLITIQVAKETAGRFNPSVKLEAHHANIKDPRFSIDWFQGFQIVFNALDNLDARRHVNKMCLAADVPLIESGTTGFNGQVQVIKRVSTRWRSEEKGVGVLMSMGRDKRNATTVMSSKPPRASRSAPFARRPVSPSTASSGPRVISSRKHVMLVSSTNV